MSDYYHPLRPHEVIEWLYSRAVVGFHEALQLPEDHFAQRVAAAANVMREASNVAGALDIHMTMEFQQGIQKIAVDACNACYALAEQRGETIWGHKPTY